MAGRKKSVSVQEELLLCPSAKPGDWFPGIPVSAVAGIDEAGRGSAVFICRDVCTPVGEKDV